jgi:thiosulfate/3-mercaptopyruvate sulfurtransferase
VARLRVLGVDSDTLVVAYDGQGSMYAARLWWMLRWIGHAAAVLDGGRNAWVAAACRWSTAQRPSRRSEAVT